MRRTIIALGIAAIGLPEPASASPEAPTLLETAIFLISGHRASEFKQAEGLNGVMFREFEPPLPFMRLFAPGKYEYIVVLDEKQCLVGRSFSNDLLNKDNTTEEKLKLSEYYYFNKINGSRNVFNEYSEMAEARYEKEVMTGNEALCKTVRDDSGKMQKKCSNDMTFINHVGTSEVRFKAWQYLYSNYCDLTKQPF